MAIGPPATSPPPAIIRYAEATRPIAPAGENIVESVSFVVEYRRAHPDEKAALLLPPLRHPRQSVLSAAAFTRNGQLFIHSPQLGDAPLDGHPPEDIDRRAELYAAYEVLLRKKSPVVHENSGSSKFGRTSDESAGGRLARALARLQEIGVTSKIIPPAPTGARPAYLILEYGGMQFGWVPSLGISFFNGLGDPPVRNSVIEAILFSTEYRRAHPTEKVAVYIDALPDASMPGRMVATTVYTSEGRVYSHHLLTGDLESTLQPADLENGAKVIEVTRRIYQARRAKQRVERRKLPPAGYEPADPPESQPEIVAAQLNACGVPSRLVRIAGADVHGGDRLAVRFERQGESYIYSAELGCFRGNLPQ